MRLRFFSTGETLVFGVTPDTPDGLIALVTRDVIGRASTTVDYVRGGLLDAYRELDLTTQVPLGPTPLVTRTTHSSLIPNDFPGRARGQRTPDDVTPVNNSFGHNFSGSHFITLSDSPPVDASVDYGFTPSMTLVIMVHTSFGAVPSGIQMYYASDASSD